MLVYSRSDGGVVEHSLVWVDRTGENIEQASQHTGTIGDYALSPKGTHIAVSIQGDDGLPPEIWVFSGHR